MASPPNFLHHTAGNMLRRTDSYMKESVTTSPGMSQIYELCSLLAFEILVLIQACFSVLALTHITATTQEVLANGTK